MSSAAEVGGSSHGTIIKTTITEATTVSLFIAVIQNGLRMMLYTHERWLENEALYIYTRNNNIIAGTIHHNDII